MNDTKLSCLVEGYEGTYFEIGQIWETRDENIKAKIIGILANDNYPILCEYHDSFEDRMFESTVDIHGKFNKSFKHRLDLTKLISTETTSYDHNQKTFSEYLKENNAYESFVENSVECFLSNKDDYHEMKLENDIIYLGNAFNWRGTEQGNDYWYNLHNTQPYDLIYDMNEIIFAEVDRRIAEQKVEPEFITDEEFSKMLTVDEFRELVNKHD